MARRRFGRWTPYGRVRVFLTSGAVFEIRGRVRPEHGEDGFSINYEIESEETVVLPHFSRVDAIGWEPIRPEPEIPRGEP